jgi:hypothetical protein
MTIQVLPLSDGLSEKLDADGVYLEDKFTIMVRRRTSPAEQARILIHELLHACYDAGGWGDEGRDQEGICSILDRALAKVLVDNPHLFPILYLALHQETSIFNPPPPATDS